MRSSIVIGLLVFMTSISFGTVDYLCANAITKELYWADDDNSPGFLGWKSLSENYEPIEKQLLNSGYTYTIFPFKLELALVLIALLLFSVLKKTRKRI